MKKYIKTAVLPLVAVLVYYLSPAELAAKSPEERPPQKVIEFQIDPKAWGIRSPYQIGGGQIGVLREKKGDRVVVYALEKIKPKFIPQKILKSAAPQTSGNCFILSHFDRGVVNRLGGYYNHFFRRPSWAKAAIKSEGWGAPALELRYRREKHGFCGMWIHLFNFKLPITKRIYFNSTPFKWFVFWINSDSNLKNIIFKVADAVWEKKGDALKVGSLEKFAEKGTEISGWKRVVIPLKKIPPQIDRKFLAALVFEITKGTGKFAIKTAAFCRKRHPLPNLPPISTALALRKTTAPPQFKKYTRLKGQNKASPPEKKKKALSKATWLWDPQPYLKSPKKLRDLVRFLKRRGITEIFIQLPNRPRKHPKINRTFFHKKEKQWKLLLASLSRAGITSYALDGYKNYALPEWHPVVIQTIEEIAQYNSRVRPRERFAGVHLDIEPYLLTATWFNRRLWLVTHYLQLLTKASKLAHANGLQFEVDIPFWWDERDPFNRDGLNITFKGQKKFLAYHVIDIADRVGIMNYRTQVYGADGAVATARSELKYAEKKNKKILIGIETYPLPPEFLFNFRGRPLIGWPLVDAASAQKNPYYLFLLSKAPDPPKIYTGSDPAHLPPALSNQTLVQTFRSLKMALVPTERIESWRPQQGKRQFSLYWPIREIIYVSPDKLSFANLGLKAMEKAVRQLTKEFSIYSSFGGIAIHSLNSYRKLVKKDRSIPK